MDPVLDTIPSRTAPAALPAAPTSHLKPLWAAVGVLGVAVVALGGTLVYQHGRDAAPAASVAAADPAALAARASGPVVTAPASLAAREEILDQKEALAQAGPAQAAPKFIASASPAPVVSAPRLVPAPAYPSGTGYTGSYGTAEPTRVAQAAPVCAVCGRIESVSPVQRAAPATGIGAVAGGVLGAVVGNQIGHGGGRTAATLLGAAGGGYLGHTVEQRTRTQTAYLVRVRMDDGSHRTFERAQTVPVGERVTVEGRNFRLGQGASYSTEPSYQQVAQPQGEYSTSRY